MKPFLQAFVLLAILITYQVQAFAYADQKELPAIIGPSEIQPPEFRKYMDNFFYTVTGDCGNGPGLTFHYISTFADSLRLPDSADGRKRKASLAIFLEKNNTYVADYREMIRKDELGDNPIVHEIQSTKRVSGRWFIKNGILHLTNLGEASPITYGYRPALNLKIASFKPNSYVNGQSVVVEIIGSTAGRDPYESVCHDLNY